VDKSSKVREARVSEIVLKSSKAADTAKIALAEQEEENMTDEKPRPEVPRSRRKQLIRQLERKDLAERFTAAESLALRGADWALEPLADILDDDREIDPGKRLGSEGPVDSLAAVRVLPLTPGLAAAYALSRIGPRGMERLNSAAGHRKPAVRRHAVAGLTFRRGRRSTEALIRALGDEDLEVQFIAATELREREPVDPLIAALSDRNAGIRKHAVEILGELKAAKAADHIMVALKDHNSGVREKAAYAIGRLEDRRAGELLLSALNDGVSFVRRNAAEALGRIREPRAVEPLINTLKDKSALVRRAAATALGRLRDTRAIEPLSNATRDSDPEVQQAAREALALHTDIGELVEALADTSPFVRKNAQYALFLMTGQPHGTDVEKWRSWWKENKDNLVRTR
jgi:HEAT repeat protein